MKVDFIFDFASPNAYFCHKLIPIIEDRTDVSFNYIPCLLGGIFKLSGNQPPFMAFADIPNKNAYQMIEIERFVKQHELTKYQFNSNFPINTVQIQRGSIAAQELNVFDQYLDVVITAMWEDNKNLNDLDILKATLNENNMDVEAIFNIVNSQECKDKLIANTSAAVERGAFGVPTFFLDDQIFFGKDHLYQLEEYINSNQK
ncbi:MAG: disulfide bond formation protein DsbA [Gammaproteobacteria bacterium TMED242]|jgi:2-hydroxychromene-2-carboxylate isomerase|uniref:2-hydroxychromene-2-carboxylate isomerase n=1 Tax=SAR86 cluster bacterium TaxID=2030880 RepID=A0A520MQ19_9GAMM|nr:MAG: disulfide bond formation protein DsbA [Gammaproteobacteria bacterium TMED242]RZO23316.1 MAG: 2-hydroxychromene-2-carboxylate isomerase [SAR86 cluster bacterium]|tara:strand:- start:6268 stop:6873 length:606 start_codon:yes stop_codon:yes gene_type:complete